MQQEELETEIARAAQQFAFWAKELDCSLNETFADIREIEGLLEGLPQRFNEQALREQTINGVASYLGVLVQKHFGGRWREHEVLGISLCTLKGIDGLCFSPRHLVEKKWALRKNLSIERILASIPKHVAGVEQDRQNYPFNSAGLESFLQKLQEEKTPLAVRCSLIAQELSTHWGERFGKPLPRSLVGVRELDLFLKGQFFVFSCDHHFLFRMGVFLGEVARGLYGGEWGIEKEEAVTALKLRYQELALSPVGKIYKTLSKQTEGETLEEYLLLVPSAREELRKRLN